MEAFTRAIAKGLKFIKENDNKKIAEIILPQFPDSSLNDIEVILENYKKYDSWLETPFINEDSFQNLQDILVDNNLIDERTPYKKLIHNLYEE